MANEDESKTTPDDPSARADEQTVDGLRAALEQARDEARRNHERWVRERADLENLRRRSERERSDAARYGTAELLRDLLPAVDNLERAVRHAEGGGNGQPLVEGVALVLKSIQEILQRHGVSRVPAHGEPFDPQHHEAIAHVESAEHAPNSVMEEHQAGYRLHDRLLRPALVTVAKPPPNSSSGQGA